MHYQRHSTTIPLFQQTPHPPANGNGLRKHATSPQPPDPLRLATAVQNDVPVVVHVRWIIREARRVPRKSLIQFAIAHSGTNKSVAGKPITRNPMVYTPISLQRRQRERRQRNGLADELPRMVQMSRLCVSAAPQPHLEVLAQRRQRQRPFAVAELREIPRENRPHTRETDSGSGPRG